LEVAMILWGVFFACGDKEDTAVIVPANEPSEEIVDEDCEVLTVDQCQIRMDCSVITAREIMVDEVNNCIRVSEETIDVGCQVADRMCTEAIEYAMNPVTEECIWFSNGCLPIGWVNCEVSVEECQ